MIFQIFISSCSGKHKLYRKNPEESHLAQDSHRENGLLGYEGKSLSIALAGIQPFCQN
jgi:hypothetical protein